MTIIDFIKKRFEAKPPKKYTNRTRWAPVFSCSCGFIKMLYDFPDIKNLVCPDCGKIHLEYKIIAGRRTRTSEMGAKYYLDSLISETWEIKR